jgi:2-C-methyl-D-erythritol 4-phosphate cytidylyltransferase/2-C-methyl-D-erythritol 2,4-cyclodiphosphate synthase
MTKTLNNIAIIVAAGQGTRLSAELPKQYLKINGQSLLEISINKFLAHPEIDAVAVVISPEQQHFYDQHIKPHARLLPPTSGGKERQDSVSLGLEYIKQYKPQKVLIHDAARIFLEPEYISKLLRALDRKIAAALVTPIADTIRYITGDTNRIVSRENIYATQTPQAFRYQIIKDLHDNNQTKITDDIALLELANIADIEFIEGSISNFKITTKEDYQLATKIMTQNKMTKVGSGFDAHRFQTTTKEDNTIMLCGVAVPCKYEIIAHSDGDVALHALTDALLGTIGAGDIGQHFPPSDNKWKNAASYQFVKFAWGLLKEKNATINNVDITIIAETPRIGKYREQMREALAKILEIDQDNINIKATTTEGMGFTGREEGIACDAIVTIAI